MSAESDKARAQRVMAALDATSPEIRAIVHEYGLGLVQHMAKHGITDPDALRQACARVHDARMAEKGAKS